MELERALGRLLDGDAGAVRLLERRPIAYRSTYPLDELRVRRADGTEQCLVLKDLSVTTTGDGGAGVKAPFLHDPLREIDTYRRVLGPAAIAAPACLGAEVDAVRGRYWLFLERLEGDLLWQVGDPRVWRQAAAWLARLHGDFAGRTAGLPGRLLALDGAYFRRWLDRAREFVSWPGEAAARGRGPGWLADRVEAAAQWLAGQPVTFLHGEFYPSNVVVETVPGGAGEGPGTDRRTERSSREARRIRPVDWEMAAVGPGLLDLAALLSGDWGDGERRELAEAYRRALPAASRPDAAALAADLDRCRLLLAVQWLGWAPHREVPPEHEHDWLATALELAGRTGGAGKGRRRSRTGPVACKWRVTGTTDRRGSVVCKPSVTGTADRRAPLPTPLERERERRAGGPVVRRLNWGCGRTGEPGWTNSDRRRGPHVDIAGDIREGLPVEDGAFDYVVSIHALPEVPYDDLVPVLRELRRVLAPGGVLRLGLPDLERAMRAYLDGDRGYFLVPDEDARSLGSKLVTQIVWYGYSRTPFTLDFVTELLEEAGFGEVTPCAYRKTASRFPGIVDLDNRERESLFVEAVR